MLERMSDLLRLGVLGAGSIFLRRHWPALSVKPELFQVEALCRRDLSSLHGLKSTFPQSRIYTQWRDCLNDRSLDAILIATPNDLHAEQVLSTLEAGKNVFCEKPPARTAAEASLMQACATRTGRVLRYVFPMRFSDATLLSKSLLNQGRLGEIYHIRTWWWRRRGYPTKGSWFTDRQRSGGGVLIDIGCHLLDRMLYLLGYPRVVSVSAVHHARLQHSKVDLRREIPKTNGNGLCDVEDLSACLFRLSNGVSLTLECSFAANREDTGPGFELFGDRGGVHVDATGMHYYGEVNETLVDERLIALSQGAPLEDLFGRQWLRFYADCKPGTLNEPFSGDNCTPEEGWLLMQALEAAYRSAAAGHEIRIEEEST